MNPFCKTNVEVKLNHTPHTIMKTLVLLFGIFLIMQLPVVTGSPGEVLQIHYPDVTIAAQNNGNVTGESGLGGDIHINTHNGSVYLDGVDIFQLILYVKDLPPVWKPHSNVGFVGTFSGGSKVDIPLNVLDPEKEDIEFEVIAGDLPPGMTIDIPSRTITGIAPDVDALFTFTLRATDHHGQFADAVFKLETFEYDQCEENPCRNGGNCSNTNNTYGYVCACVDPYGGRNCNHDCREGDLGVSSPSRIPDAQISGYLSRGESLASDARLGMFKGTGWCGENANSWLQIDLGKEARVFAISTEGYSDEFYTKTYKLMYSVDGTTFHDVLNNNGTVYHTFTGSVGKSTESLPGSTTARFIRLQPLSYVTGKHPCVRLEFYGCFD